VLHVRQISPLRHTPGNDPGTLQARSLLYTRKGTFMKELFGGAMLLCTTISAHAGLISFDAGGAPDGGDLLSKGSRWDSGEAWLDLDPATNTLPLQPQDHAGFQTGPTVTGMALLAEPPAADATPIPEPATLALFGLGAGALGLARQGKGKRI
jgi:hypothetical protein